MRLLSSSPICPNDLITKQRVQLQKFRASEYKIYEFSLFRLFHRLFVDWEFLHVTSSDRVVIVFVGGN